MHIINDIHGWRPIVNSMQGERITPLLNVIVTLFCRGERDELGISRSEKASGRGSTKGNYLYHARYTCLLAVMHGIFAPPPPPPTHTHTHTTTTTIFDKMSRVYLAWLHAFPLTSVGLKMDNDTLCIAFELQLGTPFAMIPICPPK